MEHSLAVSMSVCLSVSLYVCLTCWYLKNHVFEQHKIFCTNFNFRSFFTHIPVLIVITVALGISVMPACLLEVLNLQLTSIYVLACDEQTDRHMMTINTVLA